MWPCSRRCSTGLSAKMKQSEMGSTRTSTGPKGGASSTPLGEARVPANGTALASDARDSGSVPSPISAIPPASHSRARPSPQAWYVLTWMDAKGRKVAAKSTGSVAVMAVCVHRLFPTAVPARLDLLERVVGIATVEAETFPILVALPGGFFGFDADLWKRGDPDPWRDLKPTSTEDGAIRVRVQAAVNRLGPSSAVAFGRDDGGAKSDQVAWIFQPAATKVREIRRACTPVAARHVTVGSITATIFVCGEITGSHTPANGAFDGNRHLYDSVADLPGTQLLVDLAHAYVRKSGGPRHPHFGQMTWFSSVGASVLVHHHAGELKGSGEAHFASRSDWILFRGGTWVGTGEVRVVR